MTSRQLKINMCAFKPHIDHDYFKARDALYRVFIAILYNSGVLHTQPAFVVHIDESFYGGLLYNLCNSGAGAQDAMSILPSVESMHVYLDCSIYIEPFIVSHIDASCINMYHLTIDEHYNAVITHRKIRNVPKINNNNT